MPGWNQLVHFAGINPTEDGEGCKSNVTRGLQRASVAYIRGRRGRGQEAKQAAMLLIGAHQGQGKEQVPQRQNPAQRCPRRHHDPGATDSCTASTKQRPHVSSLMCSGYIPNSKQLQKTVSRAVTARMRSPCSSFPGCARLENWCPLVDSALLKITSGIVVGCSLEPLSVGTLSAFPAKCGLLVQLTPGWGLHFL